MKAKHGSSARRMRGNRTLRGVLGLSVCLVALGIEPKQSRGFAQAEEAAKLQVLTRQDLENIQRRLDQIAENHQKLLKAIEDIKEELAVIKVRVTN